MIARILVCLFLLGMTPLTAQTSQSVLKSTQLIVDDDAIFYNAGLLSINRATPNFRLTVSGNFLQEGYLDIYGDDPEIVFATSGWTIQYGEPFDAVDRTLGFVNRTSGSSVLGDSFFMAPDGNFGIGISNPTSALHFDTSNSYLEMGPFGRIEWPYEPSPTNDKDWAWISFEPSGNAGDHALIISVQDDDAAEEFELWQGGGVRLEIINKTVSTHGAVGTVSDRRIKRDISPIQDAMDKVMQLNGVWFDRKRLVTDPDYDAPGTQGRRMGFLAQDVKMVVPEVVLKSDEYYSVAYGNLLALLVEAYKDQDARIEVLLAEMDALEKVKGIQPPPK